MRYPALHIPTHSWLKQLSISHLPGPSTGLSDQVASDLISHLQQEGHSTPASPNPETDVLLTTARLGEPLGWREAFMFTARRRFRLKHVPTVFTIVHATPGQFREWMAKVEALLKEGPDAAPPFDGIPETASPTLHQQGKRGGAILYLLRIIQIQTKCIRVLLVIGEEKPQSAFLFDLVGAYPQIIFEDPQAFYKDIATRILTAASTSEITNHETVEPPIPRDEWEGLATIEEMTRASHELGKRDFFTEMIKVSQVAEIPGFSDAISQQYSEGCFATWEPRIHGLLTTITGSARPVRKENITDKDLAVIVGIKPGRDGALIRQVEGHLNQPPSSEAVEMIGIDLALPKATLEDGAQAPVIRSKLHGHRGIQSFDWRRVEYVPLPESYLHYPVSCSTDAQYRAVQEAFSRSSALQNPQDPRQLVFTVLPGHGVVIVEKWVAEKAPFQVIWEAMDNKDIEISNRIPQGPFAFETEAQRCRIAGNASPLILTSIQPMSTDFFLNKVAIVTGASAGIGRATAVALAQRGACVALAARSETRLLELANEIEKLGSQALVLPTDVRQQEQVEAMVQQVLAKWGRVDILISNAGEYIRAPIADLDPGDLQLSLDVNYFGGVYCIKAVLPHMLAQKKGNIVTVTSLAGKIGLPPDAPYVSAKSALTGFCEVLRQEVREHGIAVTNVMPGRVDTVMIDKLKFSWVSPKISPESVARAILHGIQKRKPIVIVPPQAKLLYYINVFAPSLSDRLIHFFRLEGWTD